MVLQSSQQKNRVFWVHPINAIRKEVGLFYSLFNDLRNDENKFCNYFCMSCASFDVLHGKLKGKLQRENTQFRNCIQSVEMLSITLRLVL